jgi:hypothetical protein
MSAAVALVAFITALALPDKYSALAWALGALALVLVFREVIKGKY